LGNAIKFTESGSVTLRVTRSQKSEVRSQNGELAPDSEFGAGNSFLLHFEVEDTGPGIASEEIDLLFEAFEQTETGRKSQTGTGLGLPISRKFVQLMGGDISVSSRLGKGSIFKFDIQVSLGEAIEIQITQSKSKTNGELGEIDIHHSSLSIPSLKEVLAEMPAEWLAKLHAAALSAREKEIWKLIEQIPLEKAALAEVLAQKVKDFRLDQIIEFTSND
jgi:hypothetical protein